MTDECGFTFVDFLPEEVKTHDGYFFETSYESFRTLVERANEFLRSNKKWKIVTCESIEIKSRLDKTKLLKMTYYENGSSDTYFIRGLRLWLAERTDEQESEQQIDYFNLIPQKLQDGNPPIFETLDVLIARFNSMQRLHPLPGRIITIESQEFKMKKHHNFDPDRSNWKEDGDCNKLFVFVIRIFYEIMSSTSEEIGIKDFIPDKIPHAEYFSLPYETFSFVVDKATAWCAQQNGLRYCNAQSLQIKKKEGKEFNSQRMSYTELGHGVTSYIRVLRVAYTKPCSSSHSTKSCSSSHSTSEKLQLVRKLRCRTFEPIFKSKYENLIRTKERISAWVKATGARVLSAETTTYRIISGGELAQGSEATFSYSLRNISRYDSGGEYWMYVIRLYVDGIYREPPPEMLPAIPKHKKSDRCHVL